MSMGKIDFFFESTPAPNFENELRISRRRAERRFQFFRLLGWDNLIRLSLLLLRNLNEVRVCAAEVFIKVWFVGYQYCVIAAYENVFEGNLTGIFEKFVKIFKYKKCWNNVNVKGILVTRIQEILKTYFYEISKKLSKNSEILEKFWRNFRNVSLKFFKYFGVTLK